MLPSGRPANPPLTRRRAFGQSVVEFALVLPIILLLLVAIADLGRMYTSFVAVESAAREAADFGAFDANNWAGADNVMKTLEGMEQRACTAAAGSHLQDYASTDPDDKTCTNPSFTCTLERNGASTGCASSGGITNGVDCSHPKTEPEPPCTVHVRMDYQFHLLLAIPPFPSTIAISRDSYFRISDLTPP